MKLLVAFDGSDDGFEGLRIAADMLRAAGGRHEITLVVVGWPPRQSPIWERALERNLLVDDLHRAMAEIAAGEFARLKTLFAPLGSIDPQYPEGELVSEIVGVIARLEPDLFIAGVTRGKSAENVHATALAMIKQISVPALLAFGPRTEQR